MLPRNHPDRIRIVFDDHRLVANAGLLLPATLARHLGLRELVDHHLDLGGAPGRANTGDKLMTGGLSQGRRRLHRRTPMCVRRSGGTACTLGGTEVPSTLWDLPAQLPVGPRSGPPVSCGGPADAPFTIDGSIPPAAATYGLAKEGARHHGYTGKRGDPPRMRLPETWASHGCAKRETASGSLLGRVATPGPTGSRYGPTAGSTLMAWHPSAARWMSASPSPWRQMEPAESHRGDTTPGCLDSPFPTGWTAPPYVAETTCTPFQSEPDAAPVRLIVRRVKPTPGSQLAPSPPTAITASSPTGTGRCSNWRPTIAATPRSSMPSETSSTVWG